MSFLATFAMDTPPYYFLWLIPLACSKSVFSLKQSCFKKGKDLGYYEFSKLYDN